MGLPGGSEVKNSLFKAGDGGSVHGLGKSPRRVNGNPLQYSCLRNPVNRGNWQCTDHEVAKRVEHSLALNSNNYHFIV